MRSVEGFVKNVEGSYSVGMPPHGERIVSISAKDSEKPEASETFAIESELEQLPDTPEKIADMLRANLAEINTREVTGKGTLSEEAEFVSRLESAMGDFYRAHPDIPLERRPSLSYFVSILDGSLKNILLPPEEVRALMLHIKERFGVPERGDLTILEDDQPMKGQAGRIDAHRKLIDGITESWKVLLQESWRQYYTEQFPSTIANQISNIATAESLPQQRVMIETLATKARRFSRSRFNMFLRALITEGIILDSDTQTDAERDIKSKKVVTKPELARFAGFVVSRLPPGADMTAVEIAELMTIAVLQKGGSGIPEGGATVPEDKLRLIIEGFARNIHDVYELASPDFLYERDSIPATVLYTWNTFTNPQRLQFIELVLGTYTGQPTKSANDERKKLKKQCAQLAKELRAGKTVDVKEVETLAISLSVRVEELIDFATAPESGGEEEKEMAPIAESGKEKDGILPEQQFDEVRGALSQKNAYIPGVLRILRHNDMKDARRTIFSVIQSQVIGSDKLGPLTSLQISTIQSAAGVTFNESDITAIQSVIDTGGAGTNKVGWNLLLRAGNRNEDFRKAMGGN